MTYKYCVQLIQSDYYRYTGCVASLFRIWLYGIAHPAVRYSIWLRFSMHRKGWAFLLCKLMHRRLMYKYGVQIPSKTHIGYGLYLGHCLGVVINSDSVIGNNVNISQFVTLGGVKGNAPIIGDNVYIGPGCCIVGGVHVGNDVTIGAGAVVTHDIPDGVTVAGVPAKVISRVSHPEYVNRRYVV